MIKTTPEETEGAEHVVGLLLYEGQNAAYADMVRYLHLASLNAMAVAGVHAARCLENPTASSYLSATRFHNAVVVLWEVLDAFGGDSPAK